MKSTMFPRLLICEGIEDRRFFQRLIEARQLPRFHIQDAGGNSRFSTAISTFEVRQTKAYQGLRDILIVADNDDDPEERFANVCNHIGDKFGAGAAPDAPLKPTIRKPRCTVLMLPWTGENGALETLCMEAAKNADKSVAAHVDGFLACLVAEEWPGRLRYSKAWLSANLAGRCAIDPSIALGKVFNDKRHQRLIPVEDSSFNRIADFLRGFGAA
jgi:Protein of unknown function (DUF3226)